jgi:hypothetical protein
VAVGRPTGQSWFEAFQIVDGGLGTAHSRKIFAPELAVHTPNRNSELMDQSIYVVHVREHYIFLEECICMVDRLGFLLYV